MISFQKIYGLYGLKHHTVEINGNVTLEDIQTYRHVNIELEFCVNRIRNENLIKRRLR